MIDLTNNRDTVPGGSFTITTGVGGVATPGITMTVTNIGGVAVGNITATNFIGNITTLGGNSASFASNVTAGNLIANTGIVGTLKTALQPNITQVGTLSSLSVTGNANVGNITVTGITDMCGGSMYGYQFVANAANGASTQIFSNVGWCVIAPNAVISTYTIIMPASPMDGQAIKISFANTITTLTHTTGGASLKGGFATANANVGGEWIYHSASTTWYKAS
jgi:hypothetical protein